MLKRCIIDIIEPMGFVNEGDKIDQRWVAQFLCDCTGNILTVVANETNDEQGVPRIMFNVCDEGGNLVNTITLDQLVMSFMEDLLQVPTKSHKVYIPVYNINLQVPVDMGEVPLHTFNDYVRDGYLEEVDIAEKCALEKLSEFFSCTDFNILNYECTNVISQQTDPVSPNKFAKFVREELGFVNFGQQEIDAAANLEKLLDEGTIKKLYDGTFRLLSSDNFIADYGENSPLIIETLIAKGCGEVILYKNPYKP